MTPRIVTVMIPADWIPHTRADGERVGYLAMVGEQFAPYDLFGRPLGDPVDWLDGEELLEARGIGWLAEPFMLRTERGDIRVKVTEVTAAHVRVQVDDFGAMGVTGLESWTLPLPIADELRPLTPDERHTLP